MDLGEKWEWGKMEDVDGGEAVVGQDILYDRRIFKKSKNSLRNLSGFGVVKTETKPWRQKTENLKQTNILMIFPGTVG